MIVHPHEGGPSRSRRVRLRHGGRYCPRGICLRETAPPSVPAAFASARSLELYARLLEAEVLLNAKAGTNRGCEHARPPYSALPYLLVVMLLDTQQRADTSYSHAI